LTFIAFKPSVDPIKFYKKEISMKNAVRILFVLLVVIPLSSFELVSQIDNEFWFVAPEVNDEHGDSPDQGQPTYLRISTDSLAASVKIYQPAKGADPIYEIDNIPPFSTRSIKFRRDGTGDYDLNEIENELHNYNGVLGNISNKGIRIEATTDITAYYEVAADLNREILSLKGGNALGKEFYVPFQTKFDTDDRYDQVYSAIDIVATENNTNITIEPTEKILIINSSGQTEHTGPYSVNLDAGETFSVVPFDQERDDNGADGYEYDDWQGWDNDPWHVDRNRRLDGTKITADTSIAVQTKDDLVNPPYGVDFVADQLVPVKNLGTEYIINRGKLATDQEWAYVLATEDNTEVFKDGASQGFINAGETLPIKIDDSVVQISAQDSSVYVYHVSGIYSGIPSNWNDNEGNQVGGALIPTISECTGSTVVPFVRTTGQPFYINLLVRDGAEDDFILNGDPNLISSADFESVPGPWNAATLDFSSTADLPVGTQSIIRNTSDVFHIGILNGLTDSYYGYFSEFQQVSAGVNMEGFFGGVAKICYEEELQLWAKGATVYKWESKNPPSYMSNPTSRFPVVKPKENKEYRVIIEGFCNLKDTSQWADVTVADPLKADFISNDTYGCSPFEITLRDSSIGATNSYEYYFGDGTVLDTSGVVSGDTVRHVYSNTTDTMQNPMLTLIVENTWYCKDSLSTDFVVYPEISASFAPDTTDCSPLMVPFENLSAGDTSDYRWKFGDGAISKEFEPSHVYTNYSDTTTSYEVSLISTAGNNICKDTAIGNIAVHPHVKANYTINRVEGCSPLRIVLNNTSVGEDSLQFHLKSGLDSTMNACDSLVHTYRNTGAVPDTHQVRLRVWNDAKCTSIADTTEIIVYPEIRAQIAPYDTIGCNSIDIQFTNNTNSAATNFSWDFGDGTSSSAGAPSHEYENKTNGDTVYTVNYHAESDYGCSDDTTATIRVRASRARFDINQRKGCAPLNVQITNNSKGSINNYTWSFGDGSADNTTSAPGNHSYDHASGGVDTSMLQLIVEGNDNCRDTAEKQIITYSSVEAQFGLPANTDVCSPQTITFNDQSSAWASEHNWSFGDGTSSTLDTVSHEYAYNGYSDTSYNVHLEVSTPYGCTDDTLVNNAVTIYPAVKANFSLDVFEACSPVTVDLSAQNNPAIGNYQWDFDNGNQPAVQDPAPETYVNKSGSEQTKTIELVVEDQSGICSDIIQKELKVFSEVTADFSPVSDTAGCNPLAVQFTEKASAWADKYSWDFAGNGTSTQPDPSYTFHNNSSDNQDYTVQLEVETANGCTHDTSRTITVHPFINAEFSVNQLQGCSPFTLDAEAVNYGGIGDYEWDFGNGNTPSGSQPSEQTYVNDNGGTDQFTVQLTVTDKSGNCTVDTIRTISVWSSVEADFTVDTASGCNPLTVQFNGSSSSWTNSRNWVFGDGTSSALEDPEHTFENPATRDSVFHVRMMAQTANGCKDTTDYLDIEVFSYLNAGFSITDNEGCPPFTTSFENNSVGNTGNIYSWEIDNAPVGSAPGDTSTFSYTFENNTTTIQEHEIQLTAENSHGCQSIYTDSIRVYQNVDASFGINTSGGCSPLTIDFTDNSAVPSGSLYSWDYGDGASSSETDPSHVYYNYDQENDKDFTATLTVSSPYYCSDDTSLTFTVYHQPEAKFDINETSSCPPLESTMENISVGHDSFEWQFGDGTFNTTNNTITHPYPNNTNSIKSYELELLVSTNQGCSDSTGLTLNVFPNVIADFGFADGTGDCHPYVAEMTDSSLNADSYYWEFGDGSTSGQENPIHRFTNTTSSDLTYSVFLRASSEYDCWDTISQPLTVYAQPDVEFIASPQLQTFPEARVFLTNKSNEGPWTYNWSFDDGNTDHIKDPNYHDYTQWGEYEIGLGISSNTSYCRDTMTKTISILPPEVEASYQLSRKSGCEPLTVEFEGAESVYDEEYSYTWEFGDGYKATGRETVHTFDSAGTYYVKMEASGEGGTDHAYDTVRVYKRPVPDFEVEPKLVMLPDQRMHCYNLSKYGDSFTWYFGDGVTSTDNNPKHLYTELGKYDIKLVARTGKGCRDSILKEEAVEVRGKGFLRFPTAFTPSKSGPSDGTWNKNEQNNDIFHPVGNGVMEYKLQIFNKWGELLFESTDFNIGWDGYYQGELLPQDVYVWKIEAKFSNGKVIERMGDVTLIR